MSRGREGNRSLTVVDGLRVGHAEDREARTGCTVVLGPFRGAVEVLGRATGTRELDALSPGHVVPRCDALLLTGGSAFGLAAADGVVRWLESRGRGFRTSAARVPIVPAAVLYDLAVGEASVRPDAEMGRRAAEAANEASVPEGAVGAGCGATVGKLRGGATGDPSGIGTWAEVGPGPTVGALAVVNAFGDVVDGEGRILAGARARDGSFLDTARSLREGRLPAGFGEGSPANEPGAEAREGDGAGTEGRQAGPIENTTLAVVATDAPLGARDLEVVARQAANGLTGRIRPCATPFDGDLVFALSTGSLDGEPGPDPGAAMVVGARAQAALERAIQRAVGRGSTPSRERERARNGSGEAG